MTYDDLDARDQALFDEAGGSDGTFVSARMVQALQGNGNAAIFLSQLMKWSKWKADDEGWFFRTRDEMQKQCGLSAGAQRTAEKTLKTLELIETDRRGMPAKKHYRLHIESIISVLAGDEQDMGGSGGNKSSGVPHATSSGGYPQEQDVGGSGCNNEATHNAPTCDKSNTENNRENIYPREEEEGEDVQPREGDPPGVVVWIEVTNERPSLKKRRQLKEMFTGLDGLRWNRDAFRESLHSSWLDCDMEAFRINVGRLKKEYKKELKYGDHGSEEYGPDIEIEDEHTVDDLSPEQQELLKNQ